MVCSPCVSLRSVYSALYMSATDRTCALQHSTFTTPPAMPILAGPQTALDETTHAQPALLVAGLAAAEKLRAKVCWLVAEGLCRRAKLLSSTCMVGLPVCISHAQAYALPSLLCRTLQRLMAAEWWPACRWASTLHWW